MAEYDLVFEKLAEALETETDTFRVSLTTPITDAGPEEMQEIEELRRLAEELEEPEPSTFAST